ncbi:MAG TPA: methyltransferase domain-containing protein [Anaerolineales bacterium]|nr:methyltransferase domain-containing protein [Anaerolineales bacterium]
MIIKNKELFNQLVSEALEKEFSGWDFGYIAERWKESPLSWDYLQIVREHIKSNIHLLDIDTGGGEILSSLQPLPLHTYATEGYPPNVPVAKRKLEPLGVKIVQTWGDDPLPFERDLFNLVINRHGAFIASELHRVLKPNGLFITQQVGGQNNVELNQLIQDKPEFKFSYWTLDWATNQLVDAGFRIYDKKEEFPETIITDIGALVFHLKVISWQIEDFSVEKYHDKLVQIHNTIQEKGDLRIKSHRILIAAKKF